ncbi:putative amino acid transporter [Heterobasidion irregulare TC 32-1]|uniref:Putative amino acid transporter n=1 Tax=Heterobasidion irregulare (strain TC 32-1) TaxID=747525 RepID=W4JUJ6_HETIT|nr:putative amino acid transporter [Heterobasidion irregulare TC 32-1]ETW76750.1 putative amino acid transporter [Heterobasidion irregulare TC 32-1]
MPASITSKDNTTVAEVGLGAPAARGEADEAELARMGYKQELKRDLSMLQNFGFSFSIISVITGIPSLFAYGLTTGGPAVMVWGWVVVAFFTMLVGLAMAEVCSAHPTSGGPYFWAAMLSRPQNAAFASWVTGWFNLLGQVAVTTGISFACANFLSTACTLGTNFEPTRKTTIGIYAAVLFTQGMINTFGVHSLKYLNNISVWWHAVGTVSLVIAILVKAPTHQSGSYVFTQFIDGTGVDGPGWSERASSAYVVVVGILMAQYTLTGFDASAHMTEETHNAAMAGSIGIVMAIGVSAVLGWFLLLGLLFSMQDYDATVGTATGQPVTQIFLDTVGEKGAIVLMVIVIGAMFFCGTFSVTSNSRMMYAFARDGGIPGHKFFHSVDKRWRSPVRTVWLACTLSFLLGLPSLGSSVAFSAATSIATIGLYISYAIPIALRVIYHDQFVRGPFHLGVFSFPVAITAVTWIAFISIVFILPELNPVNSQTLNYAIVAVGIVLAYSLGFWFLSARKWFTGPVKQIEAEAAGIDVTDPAAMLEKEHY